MLSSVSNYPENEDEIKLCLHHYQSYRNSVKEDLKIDYVCEAIDITARSIESNLDYLYHYQFIDVARFEFLGDSIIEAEDCGLKGIMLLYLQI